MGLFLPYSWNMTPEGTLLLASNLIPKVFLGSLLRIKRIVSRQQFSSGGEGVVALPLPKVV